MVRRACEGWYNNLAGHAPAVGAVDRPRGGPGRTSSCPRRRCAPITLGQPPSGRGSAVIGFLFRNACFWMLVTLWVVFTVSFFLMRGRPGRPVRRGAGARAGDRGELQAQYRLDLPVHVSSTVLMLGDMAHRRPRRVDEEGLTRSTSWSAEGLPVSAALGLAGVWRSRSPSGWWRASCRPCSGARRPISGLMSVATIGIALPNFVVAGFAIIVFVFTIPLLPAAGWGSLEAARAARDSAWARRTRRTWRGSPAPACSTCSRRTTSARRGPKGLSPFKVVLKHALPTALLPVVSFLGPAVAGILTGSPVSSRSSRSPASAGTSSRRQVDRDYPIAMGLVLLYTIAAVLDEPDRRPAVRRARSAGGMEVMGMRNSECGMRNEAGLVCGWRRYAFRLPPSSLSIGFSLQTRRPHERHPRPTEAGRRLPHARRVAAAQAEERGRRCSRCGRSSAVVALAFFTPLLPLQPPDADNTRLMFAEPRSRPLF